MCLATLTSAVAQTMGTWTTYPTFAAPPQKVIEASKKVYYLSGGNLFSYDKKGDETYAYTTGNKLNDCNITNIFYNHDKDYLLVAYNSGNIDLVYGDGKVVNMSDIKDSTVDPPRLINNVAFDGDNIYVATGFGLVHFNEPRHEVVTSGIYSKAVNGVAVMGSRLVIHADGKMLYINKGYNISSLSKFTPLYNCDIPYEIKSLGDNELLIYYNSNNGRVDKHTIDFDNNSLQLIQHVSTYHTTCMPYLIVTSDEEVMYVADNKLYKVTDDAREQLVTALTDDMKDGRVGTLSGRESVWSLTRQGLANHGFDGEGGVTVMMDRSLPDAFPVSDVCYFFPSADGKRLYAQNAGITSYKFGRTGDRGNTIAQTAARIDLASGDFEDVSCYPVEAVCNEVRWYQNTYGPYPLSPTSLAEDPNDPSVYYLSTADDGVYKVKDGKLVGRYNLDNSPMQVVDDNRSINYGISIDRGGNLWVVINHKRWSYSPLMILPADKLKLDPSQVKAEDWYHPDLLDLQYWGGQDVRFLHCKKSNMIFIIDSGGQVAFVIDTRGTFNNLADDKYYLWESFIDQDGKKFEPKFVPSIVEDLDGKVWIGTNEGIIEITNPSNATNSSMRVTHLKIPRNDGSNQADYLLGTELCMDISVDAANRKWVATSRSGLFLVNPQGNAILQNFTTKNSALLSDHVYSVFADPFGSDIYVGSANGLMTYRSNATPTMSDFSEVVAYPNPVRPEYDGDIYVRGLMDNTLVKIADAGGHVVYQGRSEGGLFTWNGRTASGARVKSGVYYVMVSAGGANSGSSSAAVTKIMIVN